MKTRLCLFVFLLLLSFVQLAFATEADVINATNQFRTYGGTNDVIADAFDRLTLIMINPTFKAGYGAAFILACVFGGLITVFRQFGSNSGGLGPWFAWFGTIIFGSLMIVTFFNPGSDLYITDVTTNDSNVVQNVPRGILITAGFFNGVESWLIDLVDVVGIDGQTYRSGSGGVAFSAIASLFSSTPDENTLHTTLSSSLRQYCYDCAFYEFTRPGSILRPGDFYQVANNDMVTLLGGAASPSNFTTYYANDNSGNPVTANGVNASCNVAWNGGLAADGVTQIQGIRVALLTHSVTDFYTQQCSAAGFDSNSIPAQTRCRQLIRNTIDLMLGGGLGTVQGNTDLNLVNSLVISQAMTNALSQADKSTQIKMLANEKFMESGLGMGVTANNFVPIIRASVLTIFLGIFPFLCFLIPTPLIGKVLSFLFGSFMFLCTWGVCDALVNNIAFSYATKIFRELSGDQLGMANLLLMPSVSMKALAMYGNMRFLSMIFAGVCTSMLFRFGGHFMSSFSGQAMATASGAGAGAGITAMNPVQHSTAYSTYANAPSSFDSMRSTISHSGDLSGYTAQASGQIYQDNVARLDTASGLAAAYGGHEKAGMKRAEANVTSAQETIGSKRAVREEANAWGTDVDSLSHDYSSMDLGGKSGKLSAADITGQSPHDAAYKEAYTGALPGYAKSQNMYDSPYRDQILKDLGVQASVRDKINSIIPTVGQELSERDSLSPDTQARLADIAQDPKGAPVMNQMLQNHFTGIKLWADKDNVNKISALSKKHGLGDAAADMENGGAFATSAWMDDKGNLHFSSINGVHGSSMNESNTYSRTDGHTTRIGDTTNIGDDKKIGNNTRIGDTTNIGKDEKIGDNIRQGSTVVIGEHKDIGNKDRFGNEVGMGNYAALDAVMLKDKTVLDKAFGEGAYKNISTEQKYINAQAFSRQFASDLIFKTDFSNVDSSSLGKSVEGGGGFKIFGIGGTAGASYTQNDQAISRGQVNSIEGKAYEIARSSTMNYDQKINALNELKLETDKAMHEMSNATNAANPSKGSTSVDINSDIQGKHADATSTSKINPTLEKDEQELRSFNNKK